MKGNSLTLTLVIRCGRLRVRLEQATFARCFNSLALRTLECWEIKLNTSIEAPMDGFLSLLLSKAIFRVRHKTSSSPLSSSNKLLRSTRISLPSK